jgi:DNA-binding NarL/FixJ family response regulator
MRVLLVADRMVLAREIRGVLEKTSGCVFEIVHALDPGHAAAQIQGTLFDLLLLDLGLGGIRRSALVDIASDLATRLPVVTLSGTEALPADHAASSHGLRSRLEEADLPAVLFRTRRRARRLGAVALAPVFCRLELPSD